MPKLEPVDEVELAYVLMHPVRYRIARFLEKSDSPRYIAQIAKEFKLDNKLISFHLSTMDQHGLVKGEFDLRRSESTDKEGRPMIVKYYRLTDEARRILAKIQI